MGWLGLTLGDWLSRPRSLGGKDEPGPPGLEGSPRVNLDHGMEKFFRKNKNQRKMENAKCI